MKLKSTKRSYNEPADEFSFGKPSKKLIKRQAEEQEAQEEIDEFLVEERNPQRIVPMGRKRYNAS